MFIKIENSISASGGLSTMKEFLLDRNIRVLKGSVVIRDNNGSILPQFTSLDDYQIALKTNAKDFILQQGTESTNSLDAVSLNAFLSSERMPPFIIQKGNVLKMQTQHNATGSGILQAVPITITLVLMYEQLTEAQIQALIVQSAASAV